MVSIKMRDQLLPRCYFLEARGYHTNSITIRTPLILVLNAFNSKTSLVTHILIFNCGWHVKIQPMPSSIICIYGCYFFFQGNIEQFIKFTGWYGPNVLYFGDHVYSDLRVR